LSDDSFQENFSLEIYNIRGQKVKNIPLSLYPSLSTSYSITWDGTDEVGHPVSSGIYFAILKAGKEAALRNMLLLK